MSRVTAPISKLTRSMGSTSSFSKPSQILGNASKAASNAGRKHETKADEVSIESAHSIRTITTSAAHRPSYPVAPRKVPLMQGFRTSAPKAARADTSHIDFMVFPGLPDAVAPDPYANIRVPLLPDNNSPAVSRAVEEPDAPLAQAEILVIAANPDNVMPAALTEVEGMGVDGVELKFAHDLHQQSEREPGMLTDLWKGLVDDVFGTRKPSAA